MNRKILSIVIPAYNAERYLEKNLDTILGSQDILKLNEIDINELLEVLVVNDGSGDNTQTIAEKYESAHPKIIRVINKENGGHGSAINVGIEYAQGKYFKVIDADDWVDSEAFAHFLLSLKEADSDIVYSGFEWAIENNKGFKFKKEFKEPFIDVEYGREYKFADVASKLYIKMHHMTIKTEIYRKNKIRIDEHLYYVDTEFVLYPIPYIETITFTDDFVYMYRLGRAGQSMDPEKLLKNEIQFEFVLNQLLKFYTSLLEDNVDHKAYEELSRSKIEYVENFIARIYAGRIKILLSAKSSKVKYKELVAKEATLRKNYPKIYRANINKAIKILRKSKYKLYYLATFILKIKNKNR